MGRILFHQNLFLEFFFSRKFKWTMSGKNWRMWQRQCSIWWAGRRRRNFESARSLISSSRFHMMSILQGFIIISWAFFIDILGGGIIKIRALPGFKIIWWAFLIDILALWRYWPHPDIEFANKLAARANIYNQNENSDINLIWVVKCKFVSSQAKHLNQILCQKTCDNFGTEILNNK